MLLLTGTSDVIRVTAGTAGHIDAHASELAKDIALAKDPQGWGAKGHPEWGTFKLGKTNPNFSTSGLSATIAQYYAAVGKTEGLSLEDLKKPEVATFAKNVGSTYYPPRENARGSA